MIPVTSTKSIIPSESGPSKKRAFPSSSTTTAAIPTTTTASPERTARRMTIAPHSIIQRTSPSKAPANNRRLSMMNPSNNSTRRESTLFRSSTSSLVYKAPSPSPIKKQPLKKPKLSSQEDYSIAEAPKDPIIEKPFARLLDAYGIPITPRSQPTSSRTVNENNGANLGKLEDFMASKAKAAATASKPTPSTTIGGVSNVSSDLDQRIRVCVRKRPLNRREIVAHENDIVPMVGARTIELHAPK